MLKSETIKKASSEQGKQTCSWSNLWIFELHKDTFNCLVYAVLHIKIFYE
jgi:hypothetical protein